MVNGYKDLLKNSIIHRNISKTSIWITDKNILKFSEFEHSAVIKIGES